MKKRDFRLLGKGVWNLGWFYSWLLRWLLQKTRGESPEVWQYGLSSFQTGGTKLERILPKNQHTQRKFLNFETWTNGEPHSSLQKSEFLKLILSFFHYFWCQNWDQWHKMSGKNTHIYFFTFGSKINETEKIPRS